jgi:lysophospholipase L1-like esterase
MQTFFTITNRVFVILCSLTIIGTKVRAEESTIETDPRLHSDGGRWGMRMAAIEDQTRPRILLIGDSILKGYQDGVIETLAGTAYVDTWVNPHFQSEDLNRRLAKVLQSGPYDVVHFNVGLHGYQEGRIKPGTFKPLTRDYVNVLRSNVPNAKLVWASSTPVTVKGEPTELDGEINPVIIDHNRMAAEVMQEFSIPVNDFYTLLVDKLELARGDQFHWTPEAYELLASAATASVLRELEADTNNP